ncbi:MAG: hypothetical protein D6689_05390 [Deltaproteobacteria bacterium]|nr:MAG: hypothetical protein D6689_05390 [Deltaproteobacteria bacterium]
MIAAAAVVTAVSPVPAGADDGIHVAAGIGGYGALVGGARGPAAEAEVYPGGRWGRWGVRAAYFGGVPGPCAALVAAGATYTAAATRPHLHVAFHGELAAAVADPEGIRAGAGGGVQTQVGVVGPLAVGGDLAAYLLAGGGGPALHVVAAATVRASW